MVVAPQDYYTQYDLGPLYRAGTNGTGQTIAIVKDSNINLSLVNNFRTLFGLDCRPTGSAGVHVHRATMPATRFDAVNVNKHMTLYLRFDDTASCIRAEPPWWR